MTRFNYISNKSSEMFLVKSFIQQGGEIMLCCIAILLTIADLTTRLIFFICKKTMRLTARICYAILLMSLFIAVYLIGMGIYLALGPGLGTHFS